MSKDTAYLCVTEYMGPDDDRVTIGVDIQMRVTPPKRKHYWEGTSISGGRHWHCRWFAMQVVRDEQGQCSAILDEVPKPIDKGEHGS